MRAVQIAAIVSLGILFPHFATGGTLFEENKIKAPDGRVRYFHYYLPSAISPEPPLVILFHGGSQDYSKILRGNSAQKEWLRMADDNGFLLMIPNGVNPKTSEARGNNQHWNDCRKDASHIETGADDVGFINTLIDWAIRKHHIDSTRVYAVGASNGGMMCYRLVAELSHRIAGIAAFVANLPANSECAEPRHPTSIFVSNGTEDKWMPWKGGSVIRGGKVISANATVEYWISFNKAVPSQTKRYPNLDPRDGSTVRTSLFASGLEGNEVLFYKVNGAGHTLPSINHRIGALMERMVGRQNHDIEIAQEAWNFLSRHTLGRTNL